MSDRKTVLLQAAYDMLARCRDSKVVISPMETTVVYDEAICDGYCLMEDIKNELEETGPGGREIDGVWEWDD